MQNPLIPEPQFSVSEFNEMVNLHLAHLGELVIVGEISKINVSQGKWLFITLKDEYSSVDVFGVAFQLSGWKALEEGMLVHVRGVASIHQKSGKFSIRAEQITPAGEGGLRLAFERLKAQLEAEGLFDVTRKRAIMRFPQNIGLITAPQSQAYNDFIKVLQNRLGGLKILFFPASVQGVQATRELTTALRFVNDQYPHLDALVICRGGGSLEDLQAFNDEHVVRGIFASTIPTIVGVGHEGDVSLADLAADLRASTPSNAAELLVPERQALLTEVQSHTRHIESMLNRVLNQYSFTTQHALHVMQDYIHDHMSNIKQTIHTFLGLSGTLHTSIQVHLASAHDNQNRLSKTITHMVAQEHQRSHSLIRLLNSLDYHTVVRRGFSITRSKDGKLIRSVQDAVQARELETTLKDGTIYSEVTKTPSKTSYA